MVSLDVAQVALINEVARDIVQEATPEELPLFRMTSTAFFRDPERALHPSGRDEETLGFGAEVATALAPVILAATTEVVRYLVGEMKKSLQEQSSGAINDLVKRLFRRFRTPGTTVQPAVVLTPSQLAEVRRRTLERAHQFKLSPAQAEHLADAMIATLAIGAG
jgi:hypothetical protein